MIEVFPEPFDPRTIIQYLGFGDFKLPLSELVVLHAEPSSILDDSLLCVRDESLDLRPELPEETIRFLDLRSPDLANISLNFEGELVIPALVQASHCKDNLSSMSIDCWAEEISFLSRPAWFFVSDWSSSKTSE